MAQLVGWQIVLPIFTALTLSACHNKKDNPPGDGDAGITDGGPTPSLDAACASGGATAVVKRANLVVIYDRSGSMGAPGLGDPTMKWLPVGAGLKAFFADSASVGVKSTLQYFPPPQNPDDECNEDEYFSGPGIPSVPLTALPSAVFGTSIDATSPSGNTPTVPAIQGSILLAQQIVAKDPTAEVAIVLVTDGQPDDCNSSSNLVAQNVAMVASTIPTYVVGVGLTASDMTNLAQIATAGGTGTPIAVTVGDPDQTKTDIITALNNIRVKQVPCSFPIPAPPNGKTLNFKQVNVVYTPSGGAGQTLTYESDCTSGAGWDYDNVMNPTKINLCPDTCHAAQIDTGAQVEIVFGCGTQGVIK